MALRGIRGRRDRRKTRATHGKYRWTRGVHGPSEQKFSSRATDTPLTGTHSAAGVQFGSAPGGVFLSICQGDIFAAAKERVRLCERREFGAQRERLLHGPDDFPVTLAGCE